jgi:hypothetical protein
MTLGEEFVYNRSSPMRSLVRYVLLGGSLFLSGAAARAEQPGPGVLPVQVIAIQSDGADDQAEALTAAIRSRVRAVRSFSLHDSDFALEVLTLGFKCGDIPDEACQAKIGDHIHADRYIWGTVKRSKSQRQVTAEIRLWTRGRPTARTQLTFSDNLTTPGDEALKRLVEDALGKLLEPPKSEPPPAASTPARVPGVVPPIPTASAARVDAPPTASADIPEEASSDGRRTTGWVAVGLGGVLLGVGVYSVVRVHVIDSDDRVEAYRQGFHSGVDVCDQARSGVESKISGAATAAQMKDFCSSATTFQTLQYIFFGIGAISAGAGIYLLASDKTPPPSSTSQLRVLPSCGGAGAPPDHSYKL